MAYELRDGQGSLFVNDKKTQDNHPDRTGTFMLNGQKYKIAGWLKPKAGGGQFLSLKVEAMEQPQQVPQRTADGNSYAKASGGYKQISAHKWEAGLDDLNDSIPF